MSKVKDFFKSFRLYEILLILLSLIAVIVSSILCKSQPIAISYAVLSVVASFLMSKGVFFSPICQIVSMSLYCFQAYSQKLYGEIILNAAILIPIQIASIVSWFRSKHKTQVKVAKFTWKEALCVICVALILIAPTYFGLKALGTNYLPISVATFILPIIANYLCFRRTHWQFVAYTVQSLTLMFLWLMPIMLGEPGGIELIPVAITFFIFVINDIYGFINWLNAFKTQKKELNEQRKEKLQNCKQNLKKHKKFNLNKKFKEYGRLKWNF